MQSVVKTGWLRQSKLKIFRLALSATPSFCFTSATCPSFFGPMVASLPPMTTPLFAVLLGPVSIVALSVAFIVAAIVALRLHAFFALIIAAAFVSLMTAAGQTGDHRFVQAIESVMTEFGGAAGRIGFTIAAAAVIGMCLMESGAADKIIRRFIAVFGESRAAVALLAGGFILSAPVFFETVMMLMLPLARALSLRTGKNYLLYALVICAGSAIANGIVPPAPGPLFVAGILKLELGKVILAGIACGVLPALGALALARWFDARMPVPVRPTPGSTLDSRAAVAARPESELPGFWASIVPVLLPILLIAAATFLPLARSHIPSASAQLLEFLGNKNVALLLGAILAVVVYARQKKIGWHSAG